MGPVILEPIRRAMRGPIPMFGGRSLVELVQTEWVREQVRAWPVGQLAGISLEPLWRDLGLDYEG